MSIVLYILILIFIIFLCYNFIKFISNYNRKEVFYSKIPGYKDSNLLFCDVKKFVPTNLFTTDPDVYADAALRGIMKLWKDNIEKGIFHIKISVFNPLVFIWSSKYAEPFLSSNIHINKGNTYRFFKSWLGQGLLTSGGDEWRERRKLLTPAFHFGILKDFFPIIRENSDVFIQNLHNLNDGYVEDLTSMISTFTLDVICETAMGVKLNSQSNENEKFFEANKFALNVVMQRFAAPFLQPDFIFDRTPFGKAFEENLKILNNLTDSVIKSKIALRNNDLNSKNDARNNENRSAFLDLILDEHFKNPNRFSELDMRWEVNTFIFEGHDTIASALTLTLYLIGRHPLVQQKIQEELDSNIFNYDELDFKELKKLNYLDCVIKETLRLYPSVPMSGRTIEADGLTLGDYFIPEGTEVVLWSYGLHRDPDVFPEPDLFKPERFQENPIKISPFAFVPFSGGSRNCIGQKFANLELKCVLAKILSKFNIRSLDPIEAIKIRADAVLKTMSNIRVKFQPRS